jgi:hypothetical protein
MSHTISIIENANKRILKIPDKKDIDISNNVVIQYTGILYKKNERIETLFIGNIESVRFHFDVGNVGIYVMPLYVWHNDEWYKIINLQPPKNKYFIYPHLLITPECYIQYHMPLYFLNTVEDINISDIGEIVKEIDLESFYHI